MGGVRPVYAQHTPKECTHCTGICLAYAQVNISLLKSTEHFQHFCYLNFILVFRGSGQMLKMYMLFYIFKDIFGESLPIVFLKRYCD